MGVARPTGGEDVVAAVVMKEGAAFEASALKDFAKSHLAPYKVPRKVVQLDDLPRSQIGKVLRRQVREQLTAR